MMDEPERASPDIDDSNPGTESPHAEVVGQPGPSPPATKKPSWRSRLWKRARDEVHTPDPNTYIPPRRFPTDADELAVKLTTDALDVSALIFAEARDYGDRSVESRVDSVERRAATLQSGTAIAGSFTLAGAVLIATDVDGHAWQIAIGVEQLFVSHNLGMCGWQATQASSRVIEWSREPATDILRRDEQTIAQAVIDRAMQVPRHASSSRRRLERALRRLKVDMLGRAGRHLVRATLGLPLLLAVVLAHPGAKQHDPSPSPHPHRCPGAAASAGHHRPGIPRLQVLVSRHLRRR